MPPKTEGTSKKETEDEFAEATDKSYEILNTGAGIEKTGTVISYVSEVIANSGCTNGALDCWFDYVDLYVDGVLVSEGIPGYEITSYKEEGALYDSYSTRQYKIELEFPYVLYGTYKKTMFGRSLTVDKKKTKKNLRLVYYYMGHKIFSEDIVFVPEVKKIQGCPYESGVIILDFTAMKKLRLHVAHRKYSL